MDNLDRPNLFSYATSELSQDAFICWLAAWSDPKYSNQPDNKALHQTAKQFLVSLIEKRGQSFDENIIRTVDITRQKLRIDVLIEINKDTDDRLAILIEDKTHTDFHSDQQVRYPIIIIDKHSYHLDQIIAIFFKTGYQSRFDNLGEFKTYLRKDFINILQKGKEIGVNNAIYDDFLLHLKGLDVAINKFHLKSNWNREDWIGLYTAIMENRYEVKLALDGTSNYTPIHNKMRGYMLFWWHFRKLKKYTIYIQLKDGKVTFRIRDVAYDVDWKEACADSLMKIQRAAKESDIDIQKTKWKKGESMAFAELVIEDYRVFSNGLLNVGETLNTLLRAEHLVDNIIEI